MAIISPTINEDRLKIADVRKQCAEIVLAATDNVPRVHSSWKLKTNLSSIISILRRKSDQIIHSWMIGTQQNLSRTNPSGGYEYVGGRKMNREINLVIWGFFEYQLFDEVQEKDSLQIVEDEAERIADFFAANSPRLGFDANIASSIREVKPFQIEDIDVHSFAEGVDVHVAQCTLKIVLSR